MSNVTCDLRLVYMNKSSKLNIRNLKNCLVMSVIEKNE